MHGFYQDDSCIEEYMGFPQCFKLGVKLTCILLNNLTKMVEVHRKYMGVSENFNLHIISMEHSKGITDKPQTKVALVIGYECAKNMSDEVWHPGNPNSGKMWRSEWHLRSSVLLFQVRILRFRVNTAGETAKMSDIVHLPLERY
jgi:hypothetical protein